MGLSMMDCRWWNAKWLVDGEKRDGYKNTTSKEADGWYLLWRCRGVTDDELICLLWWRTCRGLRSLAGRALGSSVHKSQTCEQVTRSVTSFCSLVGWICIWNRDCWEEYKKKKDETCNKIERPRTRICFSLADDNDHENSGRRCTVCVNRKKRLQSAKDAAILLLVLPPAIAVTLSSLFYFANKAVTMHEDSPTFQFFRKWYHRTRRWRYRDITV